LAEDTADINDQMTKLTIDRKKAEAEAAGEDAEQNRLLEEALQLEIGLLLAQREREKQAYKESGAYKLMFAEDKDAATAWEAAFDQATEGMRQALAGLKKDMEAGFDFKRLAENISAGLGYFQEAASNVLSITQIMADSQIEAIEKTLEKNRELVEDERQAALEAAGFVKAATEEGLAEAMKAAEASGDEAVVYKEKRRQEELAIDKKYDDRVKTEEENAAREIADIEWRRAMADWSVKLSMAPAQIAAAPRERRSWALSARFNCPPLSRPCRKSRRSPKAALWACRRPIRADTRTAGLSCQTRRGA
jgi:hypothetical protein